MERKSHWHYNAAPASCATMPFPKRFSASSDSMLRRLLSQPVVFLFWLLHFLPLKALATVGNGLGQLLYFLGKHRRNVVNINLEWCFPELNAEQRKKLALDHFRVLGRSVLERSVLWWGSRERLEQMIRIEGSEKIRAQLDAGKPVILLAPHFVGLDAGGVAVAMRFDSLVLYLLSIWIAWEMMKELTPDGHVLRWMVPLSMALLPGYTDLMTSVNNDVAAILLFCFFLWGSLRLIRLGGTVLRLLWVGVAALLCLWTKETVLLALP